MLQNLSEDRVDSGVWINHVYFVLYVEIDVFHNTRLIRRRDNLPKAIL